MLDHRTISLTAPSGALLNGACPSIVVDGAGKGGEVTLTTGDVQTGLLVGEEVDAWQEVSGPASVSVGPDERRVFRLNRAEQVPLAIALDAEAGPR